GRDEEFKTMRVSDARFYWLSTDGISTGVINTPSTWNASRVAGTMQAEIFSKNEIRVQATGVGNITVWLGPGMLNYGEKASFSVNGKAIFTNRQVVPSLEVLLEDQFMRSDRQ